jgi:hypothetical protein
MRATINRTIQVGLTFGAIVGLIGCAGQSSEDFQTATGDLESENGLSLNGLSLNGLSLNGLSLNGLALNGLSLNGLSLNGLTSVGGLSSTTGLMTTAGGREVVKYMAKCALPAGHTLTKQDQNGVSYSFPGAIGVAPEWETGLCTLDCQERVSACMLAHVNNSGQHIGIWLDGPDNGIGWGSSTSYPYQEGAFFGNLFSQPWQGYYCSGKDMSSGEVPGRLGTPIATNVYVNPYGNAVPCKNACTITNEGYTNCQDYSPISPNTSGHKWTHVVTVWRNFEQTQMYRICTKSTPTRCLGVVGNSTADGANVEQRSYNAGAGQQWQILQVETGKYKFVNVGSGKVLDANGTQMVQRSYSGAASQKIPVVYFTDQPGWANLKPSSGSTGLSAPDTTDGALMKLSSNLSPDYAKWGFTALGLAPNGGSGTTDSTGAAGSSGSSGAGGSSGTTITGPAFRLMPQSLGGRSLEVSGGNQATNTNVIMQPTDTNDATQLFNMVSLNGGYKFTMKANEAKCIGAMNNGTGNSTQLVIQDCNGSSYQIFVASTSNGLYTFKLQANQGMCMDISGGGLSDGARLQLYACQGSNNQKYSVKQVQ